MRTTGRVKWFNDAKGFGFLTSDTTGKDAFAHFSEIEPKGSKGFKSLKEGDRVEYDQHDGPKGPKAENIAILDG